MALIYMDTNLQIYVLILWIKIMTTMSSETFGNMTNLINSFL